MFSLKLLYDLQQLDGEISSREAVVEDVRSKIADDSAVVSARLRLELIESQLEGPTAARRKMQDVVQQLEEKLQAVENRLYGGSITSPRELSAYEDERGLVQGHRSTNEEKLLELMVEVEELQSSRNEAREDLVRLETERGLELEDLLQQEERLVGELSEMRQARDATIPDIPSSILSDYESLLKARNGLAVAKVERGLCQGCRLALPTTELQRARSSQGSVRCSSCQRILYVD